MLYRSHFFVHESDVTLVSDLPDAEVIAHASLIEHRHQLERFIQASPEWAASFVPVITKSQAPVIRQMEDAAQACQVGPMAAVAGVLADLVAQELLESGAQVAVVENGGEIAIQADRVIRVSLDSPTTEIGRTIAFEYTPDLGMIGVATSSGQFGHATSLGEADTATTFSPTAGLADAAATYVANHVRGMDYQSATAAGLEAVKRLGGSVVRGALITRGKMVGMVGEIPRLLSQV
jgi:ApbE superfamily uncharacterized protein (UPF0280 family)